MFTDLRLRRLALMLLILVLMVAGCGNGTEPPDDGTEWHFYTDENSHLPVWTVRCIAIDNQGRKWLGTEGGGVVVFDDRTDDWTIYTQPGGFIWDIFVDADDTIWVGSEGSGLWTFDGTDWTRISGAPDMEILSIVASSDSILWVGTKNRGLGRYDGHTWAVYDTSNSDIPSIIVRSVAVDHQNTIWVGTSEMWNGYQYFGGGLAKFCNDEWTIFNTHNSELPGGNVYCIEIDKYNNKWIGALKGVAMFDGESWTVYDGDTIQLLNNNAIMGLSVDKNDNKWVCVYSGGFAKFDNVEWKTWYPPDYGGDSSQMNDLVYDDDTETLWVAMYGGGFFSFKEKN